jgi:START domain
MRRAFLAIALITSGAVADDAGWERVTQRDGILVERRNGEVGAVHEVRATAHSPLPPAVIAATIWKHDEYTQFLPHLKRLDVLRDEGDAKLIYEQIRVPFAKDRDVTLRIRRTFSAATGVYEFAGQAAPDEGPPPSADYVRVRDSAGHWWLEPAADGGTDVTYINRTDAGGYVPAWIVNAAQRNTVADLVRAMLDRARPK